METIKLKTTIDEKRRIMIDLPDDVPLGEVELEMNIHPVDEGMDEPPEVITREWVRAKLIAAGLVKPETHYAPDDAEEMSEAEEEELGRMAASDRPVEDYVNEDREERF